MTYSRPFKHALRSLEFNLTILVKFKVDEFYDYEWFLTFSWFKWQPKPVLCHYVQLMLILQLYIQTKFIFLDEVLYIQTKLLVLWNQKFFYHLYQAWLRRTNVYSSFLFIICCFKCCWWLNIVQGCFSCWICGFMINSSVIWKRKMKISFWHAFHQKS